MGVSPGQKSGCHDDVAVLGGIVFLTRRKSLCTNKVVIAFAISQNPIPHLHYYQLLSYMKTMR